MDHIKVGQFIAECRKKKDLTQAQLAEKLNITDRAISKWENGKAMPDSALMLDLCDILGITVNELLCGEVSDQEQRNEQLDELIFQMAKNEERYHKRLRHSACVIVATSLVALICLISLISLLMTPVTSTPQPAFLSSEWFFTAISNTPAKLSTLQGLTTKYHYSSSASMTNMWKKFAHTYNTKTNLPSSTTPRMTNT